MNVPRETSRHDDVPQSKRFASRCYSALVCFAGCACVYALPFVMGLRA